MSSNYITSVAKKDSRSELFAKATVHYATTFIFDSAKLQ